ncbi:MAG: hypothetical protein ACR2KG_11400 [Nocardioidaceae bacterium]
MPHSTHHAATATIARYLSGIAEVIVSSSARVAGLLSPARAVLLPPRITHGLDGITRSPAAVARIAFTKP